MNILVTGGSGYIGSVLVPALVEDRHDITVIDLVRPVAGEWLKRDIFDNPVAAGDLRGFDAVIHLAAIVGDEPCDKRPLEAVETNFLATKYLARAAKEANVRLIFASTCSVYGVKHELCAEDVEPEPFTIYGLTKLAAERDVLNAGGTVFRLGTVYGLSPRIRYDLVINEFVRGAKTNGSITVFGGGQMRPFLEIHNAVRAFRRALAPDVPNEVFNISDANVTLRELGKTVGDIFGCEVKTIPEIVDRRSYQVDNAKAICVLGFKPTPLAEGIEGMRARL